MLCLRHGQYSRSVSYMVGPSWWDECPHKKGRAIKAFALSQPPVPPSCEDAMRRCLSIRLEEHSHQELRVLAPWSWTCQPLKLRSICLLCKPPSLCCFIIAAQADGYRRSRGIKERMCTKGQETQFRLCRYDFLPWTINLGKSESSREKKQTEEHVCGIIHQQHSIYPKAMQLVAKPSRNPHWDVFSLLAL